MIGVAADRRCTAGSGSSCAGAPGMPDEHLVPDRVGPPPIWLLRVNHCCCEYWLLGAADPGVGDVAAGRPAVPVRGQVQITVDVHPAERRGLRDGPAVGAGRPGRREMFSDRAPEVLGRVAAEPAGVHCDVAVDPHVGGVPAQTDHRGVEADLDVQAVVSARLERQDVPLACRTGSTPADGRSCRPGSGSSAVDIDGLNTMTFGAEAAAARNRRAGRRGGRGAGSPAPNTWNSQSE